MCIDEQIISLISLTFWNFSCSQTSKYSLHKQAKPKYQVMKSIKNIFLLILIATVHSAAASETSHTVSPGGSIKVKCVSNGECCSGSDQFQTEANASGSHGNFGEDGTFCMNKGSFVDCKSQGGCTVTCSEGCSGSQVITLALTAVGLVFAAAFLAI